jgi:hypothetical protein
MEPIAAMLPSLRYLVFADRSRRHLVAAFALAGDAQQYMHQHCPCSGVLVDRRDEEQAGSRTEEK